MRTTSMRRRDGRWVAGRGGRRDWLLAADLLDEVIAHRNDEDRDEACRQHAANHGRAENVARDRPRARRAPKRKTTENEGERGHQDRAQPQLRTVEGGIEKWLAFLVFQLGELDNQDGIFRREANQHDEPDLGEYVVLHRSPKERDERAKDGDWRAQQHGEWERPTFVHGRQDEEDKEERHGKYDAGRNAFLGLLLLERHAGVV